MILNSRPFLFIQAMWQNMVLMIKRHKIKLKYKIVPIGTYCLPRSITTLCKLKPSRKQGEKSCPFDLAFFRNFNAIDKLISTRFEHFTDGLTYNEHQKYWENPSLDATFNHDGHLNREDFIKRYEQRIENFYSYINDKENHLFFLLASFSPISKEQFAHLHETIQKWVTKDRYTIIYINQTKTLTIQRDENTEVIDFDYNCELFSIINSKGYWLEELKKIKNYSSCKFLYGISISIANIILRKQQKKT